jgi:hypothetical protein
MQIMLIIALKPSRRILTLSAAFWMKFLSQYNNIYKVTWDKEARTRYLQQALRIQI